MAELFTLPNALAFITLLFLEVVLAVDNALVIILQCQGLPEKDRERAQRIGLIQGAVIRVILLLLLGWLHKLHTEVPGITPLVHNLLGIEFTLHHLINFVGGGVLIYMAGHHIRNEWRPVDAGPVAAPSSFSVLMVKLAGTNFIFSLDSVLSAVGMVDNKTIAAAAIVLSAVVMITMVARLSDLLARYPDFKTLGLCFVFCIGAFLVAESLGHQVPKAIVYSCLGFGLFIQIVDSLRPSARAAATSGKTLAQTGVTDLK